MAIAIIYRAQITSVSHQLSEWLNYWKCIAQLLEQAFPRKSDVFPFTRYLLCVGNAAGISTFLTC